MSRCYSDVASVDLQTIGTMIDLLHEVHHVFLGLGLGKFIDQYHAVIVSIGTQAKEMVNVFLGESESGGRNRYALRSIYLTDLFRFGQEQFKI